MKKQRSITKRIYLHTTIIITIITIIVICYSSYMEIQVKELEYEKDLYAITGILADGLRQSFDDVLVAKNASNLSADQQLKILNSTLQPVVDSIGKDYPEFALGFFSWKLGRNIAVVPNQGIDKLIVVPHSRPFFKIYETGKPLLIKVQTSSIWGIPTLSYSCPLYDQKGSIFGHVWANITLNKLYRGLFLNAAKIVALGIVILLLVLLLLKKAFDRLSDKINHWACAIVNNETTMDVNILPELNPILSKINNHISEIQAMQVKVEHSEERFFKAFNASPHMMSIVSWPEHKYIDVNQRFLETRGFRREDVIGKTPIDIGVTEAEFQIILHLIAEEGFVENLEVSMATKDGLKGTVLLSVDKIMLNDQECMLFAYNDISELKRMQSEIARLDRFNLIGQMAAGIGHEIRNPMTTVRGYLQLLSERKKNEDQKETFDLLISELDRANSIITEFLSLARTHKTEQSYQNLNDILEKLYPLIEADTFTQNKQIQFSPGNTPDLLLDSKQISQLVLNLARNGLEAMNEGGCLTIKTYTEAENTVVLSIHDEGTGIKPEDVERLGTPFFTTKEHGTGLGLAICYQIATSHNALIELKSGHIGTTFYVRFLVPESFQAHTVIA